MAARSQLELGEPANDPVAIRLAVSVFARLGLGMIVSLALFAGSEHSNGPLVGTWVDEGLGAGGVVYQFYPGGRGYRTAQGVREDFRYILIEGYPNELRLRVQQPSAGDTVEYRGLVAFRGHRNIRLEMGPPGEAPPHRVSAQALHLSRPPSR